MILIYYVRETEASPEEIEYLKIQDELTEQLLEQYKEVERVIGRYNEGSTHYV